MRRWFLIDLDENRLVKRFRGLEGSPPDEADALARELVQKTGHIYTLAIGQCAYGKFNVAPADAQRK